jgi:expansin (peptidoglycan-binding protein)
MFSSVHSRATRIQSASAVACALIGLGTSSAHAVWSAVGSVKNATSSNLSGVAITVKDSSSALKTTTDANGTFIIGTVTGILSNSLPTEFSIRQSGNQLQIAFPGEGTLDLQLVDLSGATLWKGRAALSTGFANATLPALESRGAAVLRMTNGKTQVSQPITLLGAEGFQVTTRISARALATYPTLVFKKVGYADTIFTMNATTQTGINVVMRDSTTPIATTCKLPSGPNNGSGSFTNYWFGQGTAKENGHYQTACGYHGYEPSGQSSDKMNNIVNEQYFVAIPGNSSSDFNTVGMCGACVELTGQNGTKIVATVTDECPEDSNQPCKNNPSGHLDVSYPAFSKLGYSVGNPSGTNWKFVKCPVTGNLIVRLKPQDNAVYIENSILPIKSVSVNGSNLEHKSYGCWQTPGNPKGSTLVITDYSDRKLTFSIPTSAQADSDINTGMQFPACN